MDAPLPIEEFNTLLTSGQESDPLLTALGKLTNIDDPEDVVKATIKPYGFWFGWS